MASKPTQLERIATLEVQIKNIEDQMEKIAAESERRHNEMAGKLDELLDLKQKGTGAFWLASTLFGIGIVTFFTELFEWWKGYLHG